MKKYICLLSLSLLFITACSKQSDNKTEEAENTTTEVTNQVHLTDEQLKQVDIQTAELTEKLISKTITVNGLTRLKPENEVEVSSLIDGQFKNAKLLQGMFVTKGQVLAQLDNLEIIDLQEQYLVAKAKYNLAKADFERQSELNKTQSASNKVVQQAKFEYTQQAILIQTLGAKLKILGIDPNILTENNIKKTLPIIAPFTGYIDKVFVTNGMYITSNTPLFKIIDASDLLVQLKVYQDDLPLLQKGQQVLLYTNTDKIKREGIISVINTQLTPEGYGEVICTVTNQNQLTPGMYINAVIELEHQKAYVIPLEAIVSFDGKQYVYVQESKNSFKPIEVEIGVEEGEYVVIKNDVDLLKKAIVTQNAYTILMQFKASDDDES